mmetsp:Transcript_11913/g.31115  ORF Transcript_11913/g.31115 Transcript_11913/m.31115 type:complete len:295 (-) Transcript_11913:284-1168(-)
MTVAPLRGWPPPPPTDERRSEPPRTPCASTPSRPMPRRSSRPTDHAPLPPATALTAELRRETVDWRLSAPRCSTRRSNVCCATCSSSSLSSFRSLSTLTPSGSLGISPAAGRLASLASSALVRLRSASNASSTAASCFSSAPMRSSCWARRPGGTATSSSPSTPAAPPAARPAPPPPTAARAAVALCWGLLREAYRLASWNLDAAACAASIRADLAALASARTRSISTRSASRRASSAALFASASASARALRSAMSASRVSERARKPRAVRCSRKVAQNIRCWRAMTICIRAAA